MTKAIKATRKLSEFNFDYEGAAVALVGPSIGGAANGRTTLLTKSLKDITETEVEKATEVTVTMNIVDFLYRFFGLWHEDATVLAMAMGYEVDTFDDSHQDYMKEYEDYIQERVDAINIMKSLVLDKDIEDIKKAVAELPSKDYLLILKAQEQFEKNFESASKKLETFKKSSGKNAEGVTAVKAANSPSVDIKEEDSMSEFITKAVHEASVLEAVQKAKDEVAVELQKAKEQVAKYEEEKKEATSKVRKQAIADFEKDAAKAEELFKSLEMLPQESFDVVVKSLKEKSEMLENSDLFVKKSKNTDMEDKEEVNGTAAILKAKYQKQ